MTSMPSDGRRAESSATRRRSSTPRVAAWPASARDLVGSPAHQIRIELSHHRSEIEVRIHHDPVGFAVRSRDEAVEAHRHAVADSAHDIPPDAPKNNFMAVHNQRDCKRLFIITGDEPTASPRQRRTDPDGRVPRDRATGPGTHDVGRRRKGRRRVAGGARPAVRLEARAAAGRCRRRRRRQRSSSSRASAHATVAQSTRCSASPTA